MSRLATWLVTANGLAMVGLLRHDHCVEGHLRRLRSAADRGDAEAKGLHR